MPYTSIDRTIGIWSLEDLTTQPDILQGHEGDIRAVAFSTDGLWLASGSTNGNLYIWGGYDRQRKPIVVLRGHERWIESITFSDDGRWLVSIDEQGNIRVWAVDNWRVEPIVLHGQEGNIHSITFSADGHWLASAGSDKSVRVWTVNDWQKIPITLEHDAAVTAVAFSADSQWLATASWKEVRMYSVNDWHAKPFVLWREEGTTDVTFSTDGRWLASARANRNIRIWSVGNWQSPPLLLRPEQEDDKFSNMTIYEQPVFPKLLSFSADSQWLASSSIDKVKLWNTNDWQTENTVLSANTQSLAFSGDGRWLASGTWDNGVIILPMNEWRSQPIILGRLQVMVNSVAFNANSQWLASADSTGSIRIFDVEDWQSEPVVWEGHEGIINSIVYSADGKWLASAGADGRIRLWLVSTDALLARACHVVGRNFERDEWLTYMGKLTAYRPTCPKAIIPDDIIEAIKDMAAAEVRTGQVSNAFKRLDQLNQWLHMSGQFEKDGVDIQSFVVGVPATATAEALPTIANTLTPDVTPSPVQPASPLSGQSTSPLPSPTVTPQATETPVAPSPLETPRR